MHGPDKGLVTLPNQALTLNTLAVASEPWTVDLPAQPGAHIACPAGCVVGPAKGTGMNQFALRSVVAVLARLLEPVEGAVIPTVSTPNFTVVPAKHTVLCDAPALLTARKESTSAVKLYLAPGVHRGTLRRKHVWRPTHVPGGVAWRTAGHTV